MFICTTKTIMKTHEKIIGLLSLLAQLQMNNIKNVKYNNVMGTDMITISIHKQHYGRKEQE